jgi:chemotaxis regulatin CheY-phosphate phosphatase CheZ
MSSQSNTEKMQLCLDFIDQRLETTAEQTIHIAEMIIEDIRSLTEGYQDALKEGTLKEHSELVRNTQMNWVNQLHDIILEQTNRDLNGQVIMALKQFVDKLNEKQFKHYQFDLPSAVASQQHSNEHEYLSQEEIDILMGQQNLFEEKTTH